MLNIEFLQSQNLPHVDPVANPVQFITPDDVFKSLRRMKNKKAAGPSGVATDMLKAAPDICSKTTADLMNTIIREGNVPADWSDSIIVSLFKGKGDVLDPNKYYRLKLTDQVPKVIEKRVESIIHKTVKIDETQFGFCLGQETTDPSLTLYSFKRSIPRNPGNCIWHLSIWKRPLIECLERYYGGLFVLLMSEWLVKVVQAMYVGARSRTHVNGSFSEEFKVKVGVHQGSVLSPLLFIIALQALSREFHIGCSWEMLYINDLVKCLKAL